MNRSVLTPGLSIWLDALRVWATVVVVLSHVAYPRFTRGDYIFMRELNLGSDSVVVFFVISGFVIAYAATRDEKLSTYAFNRLTRLLSVLLPALLLTFVFDQCGQRIGPEAYKSFYNPAPLGELLLRGLSMSNEWGAFERIRLGTNGPLWSLSYEAAFYVLFAIVFFMSVVRRIALLCFGAWLIGPRILLLMPAWLMGVWLWNWVAAGGVNRFNESTARLCAWGGPLMYIALQYFDVPRILAAQTATAFEPQHYRMVLAFSDEFIWNAILGVLSSVHIIGMARLLRNYEGTHPRIRWWAGASFSIYVTHYPALHLIDAAFPAETLARDGLLVVGSIVVGLLFAQVFERPISSLRRNLLKIGESVLPPVAHSKS
jgi:peptidoglycan/LPS O-acetylase OafA/YrhL